MTHIAKLKLLPRTTMKAKGITRLVGQLVGGDGVTISKANGIWSISLDVSGLGLVTGPVTVPDGGTGILSYAVGDMLYASGATTLAKLSAGTSGYALMANGAGVAPSYQGFSVSPTGTGAATRTWAAKGTDFVTPLDFDGADPTGVADSTAALQNWINYCQDNGKVGYFGAGTFKFLGPLTISGLKKAVFIGQLGATILKNSSTTTDDIQIDNQTFGNTSLYLGGFTLEPVSAKTAGKAISQLSSGGNGIHSGSVIRDIECGVNTFGGIYLTAAQSGCLFENIAVHNVGADQRGFSMDAASGGAIINTFVVRNLKVLNGVSGTTTTGLYVADLVSGHFHDIKIQGGAPSQLDIGIHLNSSSMADCWFFSGYTDACARPLVVTDGGVDTTFDQFSFRNGANGFDGVTLVAAKNIRFRGGSIDGNQRHGMNVTSTSVSNLLVQGVQFYHNGFEGGGSNVYSHVKLAANINDVTIQGCTDFLSGESSAHKHCVEIVAGTGTRLNINGNNFSNALTSAVSNGATGVNNHIHSNGNATNAFPVASTFTAANTPAVTALSGGTGNFGAIYVGRASQELNIAVAAGANQFVTGTAAGDAAINANAALWLGSGNAPGIRVGTSGALRFSALGTGLLHADASGDITSSLVTNGDMANMAQTTIKGRTLGGGTGAPNDLTAAQAAAIIGSVGGALKTKIITITRDTTAATANVAYTGVGFTPTAMLALGGIGASNTEYQVLFAMSDSSLTAKNMFLGATLTGAQGATFLLIQNGAGSGNQAATVVSYDADGFTLAWTKTGSPTGTATIYVMCLR
jgi:hypothetical protein